MPSAPDQLRRRYAALDRAETSREWLEAARAYDQLTGAEDWRAEDESPHYEAGALRSSITTLRSLRESKDALGLVRVLMEDLGRHLGDLSAPELYETALAGTKHLIEDYLAEVETGLRWLVEADMPGVSAIERRERFRLGQKVFGRSALLLSGGATWGFHHLGVIKALFEHGVLPNILSGASTGAMIAAGACTRNDDELAEMFADTRQIRLDGLRLAGLRRGLKERAWLAPEALYDVLQNNVGPMTFAEAYAHSGRALNISVSPTRTRQKPRLLTWLTAPDVLVASAALASSALPGLFPPVELRARTSSGEEVPYSPGERWVDGSLTGDLPKRRLARLHNVNHFIVSQTNPHALPFVRHHGQRGLRPALAGLASATVRTHGTYYADIARRAFNGPLGDVADAAHSLATQEYRGDIDIHPELRWSLLRKIVSNPTRDDLAHFIHQGERAVWPLIPRIRNQTRIARVMQECVRALK